MSEANMEFLKNERYEQKQEWKSTPNGFVAKFWDRDGRKEVFIKEFIKLRYPETTRDPHGQVIPSLVEAEKRVDRFCQKTREINAKINEIARAGGDVVVMTDFFRDGLNIFKVSELIPLEDWSGADVCKHLDVKQIDTLMLRLSRALETLHNADVLHCDLKPDNIFIIKDHDGSYVGMLSDFDDSFLMSKIPSSNDVVCTPEYMSPELGYYKMLEGDTPELPLDTASDVFALGLIYHEYLTGEFPDFSEDYAQLFAALLDGEQLELSAKLDPAHRLLLYRMMTTMPYDRITSCADVSREINNIRHRYDTQFRLTVMNGSKPLANAKVYLDAHFQANREGSEKQSVSLCELTTDANGQVTLKGLTECEYTLRCGEKEFAVEWKNEGDRLYSCSVQVGQIKKYSLKVVFDGKPLRDRQIVLTQYDDKKVKQAEYKVRTNAAGIAEFENLPDGLYQAAINSQIRKVFRWDETRAYTFQIFTYTIRLFKGKEQLPGKDIELVAKTSGGTKAYRKTVNEKGEIKLFNLNTKLEYCVRCDGQELPVRWTKERTADIQLAQRTRFAMRVVMEDTKAPVKNAKVVIGVKESGKFSLLGRGATDAKGVAMLGEFDEGEYLVAVTALPPGVKLVHHTLKKPVRLMLSGSFKKVVIKAAKNAADVVLDEDISQEDSKTYGHIVKYRDGSVLLTERNSGSQVTTSVNNLALMDLEMYM